MTVTETYSRNSRASASVVVEEVTARDEQGQIMPSGVRMTQMGADGEGPPTTITGTGKDRNVFLQGAYVRDATWFERGATVGSRDIYKVEQGVGLGSCKLFNRFEGSLTRFIKLPIKRGKRSRRAPEVLVLHAKYGDTLGDLAAYDLYPLGGPFSVRGYNLGELGSARRYLECAAEVRAQVPKTSHTAFAFYEHGSDLGSSRTVRGAPTNYFEKPGVGSSWGGGLKVGCTRFEYARECNMGRGTWFIRFGERF